MKCCRRQYFVLPLQWGLLKKVKFYKKIVFSVTPTNGIVEKVRNTVEGYFFVTPVKTGVQKLIDTRLDSRFRGNDMDNGIRLYCSLKGFSTVPFAGKTWII